MGFQGDRATGSCPPDPLMKREGKRMYAILLADDRHRNYHARDFFRVYSDYVLEKLQERVELEPEPVFLSQFPAKRAMLRKVEIILSNWGMPELTYEQVKEYLPNVKALFYAGGDVRVFASPFYQVGTRVFCTGQTNAVPASEYTLAHILLATKGGLRSIRNYRDGASYDRAREETSERSGNYQANVGIVGVGRVGSRVARLLQSFDVKVYGSDPFLPPQRAKALGLTLVETEELFRTCDVVTCHLPEWSTLRGTLGYAQFSAMLPNATFINAAQASPVDQDALIRALTECPSRTAVLDSTDPMPLPADHPLLHMPNVFLSTHIAGSFGGELERMGENVAEAVGDYLDNKPSRHEVLREQVQEHV